MLTTRYALTIDNLNIAIWRERTEDKEQTKNKQRINCTIVTEDSVEVIEWDESEGDEDWVIGEAYKGGVRWGVAWL